MSSIADIRLAFRRALCFLWRSLAARLTFSRFMSSSDIGLGSSGAGTSRLLGPATFWVLLLTTLLWGCGKLIGGASTWGGGGTGSCTCIGMGIG